MKNFIAAALILILFQAKAQTTKVEIPEPYELSNIILALTDYGISDPYEVRKGTPYYEEIIKYFEPVKNHPLLEKVNYSREKWEDYLSFRTDPVAFSFDENGKLKRDFEFHAVSGHTPFDDNLELVNDFLVKSGFRKFYTEHTEFYNRIISNYLEYNFVNQTIAFLEYRIEQRNIKDGDSYKIIVSPLVFRMNCHRNLSRNVVADFPSIPVKIVNGVINNEDMKDRLDSNHDIFTEKDHQYINPITTKYAALVKSNFNTSLWDKGSGYTDENCFNEYMTWAVYDLFLQEYFPEYETTVSTNWMYQNASRGFFAQNLFSAKVKELYNKNKGKPFETIYTPLLKWTKEVQSTLTLPVLLTTDPEKYTMLGADAIVLEFSEPMNTKLPITLEIRELDNHRSTGNKIFTELKNYKWSNDGKTLSFNITSDYKELALIFNWWGVQKPLVSKKGVFLEQNSYLLMKQ